MSNLSKKPSGSSSKNTRLTLSAYVKRRNGVVMGSKGSLKKMLFRAFGAGSFAEFWRYWNPIWGFYLGTLVFVPLKKWLPSALALIITFIASGALHDLVVSVMRGKLAFVFTPWFFMVGVVLLLFDEKRFNYTSLQWPIRAGLNTLYLLVCLLLALIVKSLLVHSF